MYDVDINITEEWKDYDNIDTWGDAICMLTKRYVMNDIYGCEYNFCIDNGINECAIYLIRGYDEDGYLITEYNTFERYEIDFDDKQWENKLAHAMVRFVEKKLDE